MQVFHTLDPLYEKDSKVLILGSMPSVISRQNNFYYAHPQNRFWPILAQIFHTPLTTIQEKKQFLRANHIALWDVLAACEITGSSDASIKNIKVNDIPGLIQKTNIQYIFCTGKKAYDIFQKYLKVNIPVFYLPSPSSANASFTFAKLVEEYTIIQTCLNEK